MQELTLFLHTHNSWPAVNIQVGIINTFLLKSKLQISSDLQNQVRKPLSSEGMQTSAEFPTFYFIFS